MTISRGAMTAKNLAPKFFADDLLEFRVICNSLAEGLNLLSPTPIDVVVTELGTSADINVAAICLHVDYKRMAHRPALISMRITPRWLCPTSCISPPSPAQTLMSSTCICRSQHAPQNMSPQLFPSTRSCSPVSRR